MYIEKEYMKVMRETVSGGGSRYFAGSRYFMTPGPKLVHAIQHQTFKEKKKKFARPHQFPTMVARESRIFFGLALHVVNTQHVTKVHVVNTQHVTEVHVVNTQHVTKVHVVNTQHVTEVHAYLNERHQYCMEDLHRLRLLCILTNTKRTHTHTHTIA